MSVVKYLVFMTISIIGTVNSNLVWETPNDALDNVLYEEALDPELCDEQVRFIAGDSFLRLRFMDAGIRTPRGILIGNTLDLGNYHQCLDINEELENSVLQGKYCMIRVPLSQNFEFPDLPELPEWVEFNPRSLMMRNETKQKLEQWDHMATGIHAMGSMSDERLMPGSPLSTMTFRLAVCIPKPCSTEQAITSLLFNVTAAGFEYQDDFCRLPDDKPWAPADTAAVVVFSVLGILTLLSTCYDVLHTFILRRELPTPNSLAVVDIDIKPIMQRFASTFIIRTAKEWNALPSYVFPNSNNPGVFKSRVNRYLLDPKSANTFGRLFSVYTNGRRLMNFSSGPGTLDCVDGVRALAMMWVIVGHSFTSESHWLNPLDTFVWTSSFGALWVTGAHITVDTFFTLSGLLVVYTTAGKLTGMKLLKNIHLFYLNRLLRMFPLLAAGVLLEASYQNRATDGPHWGTIVSQVDRCRTFWWSTLLHIQNYLNPGMTCIGQSWYLAIDTQLHILSPLVLFWVLSGRKLAWFGLTMGLLIILVASTTYNFIMEFPSSMMNPNRGHEFMYYLHKYYVNTLTRGSPFFVGMIFGYLLHIWRDETIKATKVQALLLWIAAFTLSTGVMYTSYPILQFDWDNQTLDSIFNSFVRPIWATAIGLMIFLCVQGYGGPINWFLSLSIWKLPARISYAMYIFHWGLMTAVNSTAVVAVYFTPGLVTFKALAHYSLTFVVSFLMTLTIDAPFSSIFKLLLGKGAKKQKNMNSPNEISIVKNEKQT